MTHIGRKFWARILGYRWSWGGGQVTRVELPLSTSASCGSLLAGGCRSRTLQADARTNPGNTRLAGHTDAVQMSTGLLYNSPLQDDPIHRQLLLALSGVFFMKFEFEQFFSKYNHVKCPKPSWQSPNKPCIFFNGAS